MSSGFIKPGLFKFVRRIISSRDSRMWSAYSCICTWTKIHPMHKCFLWILVKCYFFRLCKKCSHVSYCIRVTMLSNRSHNKQDVLCTWYDALKTQYGASATNCLLESFCYAAIMCKYVHFKIFECMSFICFGAFQIEIWIYPSKSYHYNKKWKKI